MITATFYRPYSRLNNEYSIYYGYPTYQIRRSHSTFQKSFNSIEDLIKYIADVDEKLSKTDKNMSPWMRRQLYLVPPTEEINSFVLKNEDWKVFRNKVISLYKKRKVYEE